MNTQLPTSKVYIGLTDRAYQEIMLRKRREAARRWFERWQRIVGEKREVA